jgi:hypothetical protein
MWGEQKFDNANVREHFLKTLAYPVLSRRGLTVDEVVNDPDLFLEVLNAVRASKASSPAKRSFYAPAPSVRSSSVKRTDPAKRSKTRTWTMLFWVLFVILIFSVGALFALFVGMPAVSPSASMAILEGTPISEDAVRTLNLSSWEARKLVEASLAVEEYVEKKYPYSLYSFEEREQITLWIKVGVLGQMIRDFEAGKREG